jgi:hypothetical protein
MSRCAPHLHCCGASAPTGPSTGVGVRCQRGAAAAGWGLARWMGIAQLSVSSTQTGDRPLRPPAGGFAGASTGGSNNGMTRCQGDVWSLLKSDTVGVLLAGCRRWAAGGEQAALPCALPRSTADGRVRACRPARPAAPRHAHLPGAGRPLPAAAGAGGGGLAGQRGALLHHSGRLPLQGRRVMKGVALVGRGRRGSEEPGGAVWCGLARRLGVWGNNTGLRVSRAATSPACSDSNLGGRGR